MKDMKKQYISELENSIVDEEIQKLMFLFEDFRNLRFGHCF
jgi:hypothetical protein